MTRAVFREDAYTNGILGRVHAHTPEGGIILDQTVFYPTGGGQPGDSGSIDWNGQGLEIATTIKGDSDAVVLVPAGPEALPPVGAEVAQHLNWERRFRHMRIHTALHLLSVVIPLPVTGGSISAEKGRLDFDMPEAPADKEALENTLNTLIARDLDVTDRWIKDEELIANPQLVKTMSVQPPIGSGQVRLVRIGTPTTPVDVQPCGGTHVSNTREVGRIRIGKIEKKGKQNRRVHLFLET
ncbi:MAG: alanyl-tRNA editing protein [Pseudoruegeria sp.]